MRDGENGWHENANDDRGDRVTVAFAGSSGLRSVRLAGHLADKIAKLPLGSVILVRRGIHTEPNLFESLVAAIAEPYGVKIEWRRPTTGGRSAVYLRDYQLVDDADYVEAYFSADRVMEGGTGHVVEAALNREKRVYGWTVTDDGRVERLGEFEPSIERPVEAR